MSKKLIFCADGTWNGTGNEQQETTTDPTNVLKTFLNLAGQDSMANYRLADEQERTAKAADGSVTQLAKYIHGVGDSNNFLVRLLGGTVGAGLITRIVRGYTFLCRNYQSGDQIYLIGFSRGAYTARALAGLIVAKGLMDASQMDLTNKEKAYRMGAAVWYSYRKAALVNNTNLFGRFQEAIVDLPGFLTSTPPNAMIQDVTINAVAVWDTVGSLGIPTFNLEGGEIDALRFDDTKLNSKVKNGLHAVSIDEERANFTPTLWQPDPRVTQVLFPGAHSDVGGGYPLTNNESDLSDASLAWMTRKLTALGVLYTTMPPTGNAAGVAHQPCLHSPWDALPKSQRSFGPGLRLSASVRYRMGSGDVQPDPDSSPAEYAPANLNQYLAGNQVLPGVQIEPI